ncbi:hypothetical protein KCU71_g2696, partial [Aureobasidium melanogenum]
MALVPPRRSEALLYIIPHSLAVENALTISANRRYLCSHEEVGKNILKPVGSRRQQRLVAKLSFATFCLRRYLCVGWSKCAEIQLPRADDISPYHFILHFDMQDATLLITDTSQTGIWISDAGTSDSHELKLLHHSTHRLVRDTRVILGHDQRFDMHISVEKYTREVLRFAPLFEEYVRSVPRALQEAAGTSKRRRSSCQLNCRKRFKIHQPRMPEAKNCHTFPKALNQETGSGD